MKLTYNKTKALLKLAEDDSPNLIYELGQLSHNQLVALYIDSVQILQEKIATEQELRS